MSDNMRRDDVLGRREVTKTGVYKDAPYGSKGGCGGRGKG